METCLPETDPVVRSYRDAMASADLLRRTTIAAVEPPAMTTVTWAAWSRYQAVWREAQARWDADLDVARAEYRRAVEEIAKSDPDRAAALSRLD